MFAGHLQMIAFFGFSVTLLLPAVRRGRTRMERLSMKEKTQDGNLCKNPPLARGGDLVVSVGTVM
jgi:hypothetical protein